MIDIPEPPETVDCTYLCPYCGSIEDVVLMQSKDPARFTKPGTQFRIPCYPCQSARQREIDDFYPDWRGDE